MRDFPTWGGRVRKVSKFRIFDFLIRACNCIDLEPCTYLSWPCASFLVPSCVVLSCFVFSRLVLSFLVVSCLVDNFTPYGPVKGDMIPRPRRLRAKVTPPHRMHKNIIRAKTEKTPLHPPRYKRRFASAVSAPSLRWGNKPPLRGGD